MKRIIAIIAFSLLVSLSVQGEIADNLTDQYNNQVQLKSFSLFGGVLKGFRSAIDYIFDTKITSMIYQIEAAADRVADHFTDDINKIIDHFESEMELLIDHAAQVAQNLIDHTIEEIKTQIIDETFAKLTDFEDKLFGDILQILDKFEEVIQKMTCSAKSIVDQIENDLRNALPQIPDPLDKCRQELNKLMPNRNFLLKPLKDFTLNELYEFRKCKLTLDLDGKSQIKAILMNYRDLEYLAGDLRCANEALEAYESEKYYLGEMAKAAFILKTFKQSDFLSISFLQDK